MSINKKYKHSTKSTLTLVFLKPFMKKYLFLCLPTLVLFGCKHTVDYSQFPEVKYSSDVSSIISGNCTESGCHGTDNPEAFDLLTYESVSKHLSPGSPQNSELYKVIRDLGGNRMPPPPSSQMDESAIKTIYLWIGQGAKNN